ncbi:FKBP-type peptidyl-prolyl cis-trans isomerase [Erythrobacter sp. EC-HK427]|uniref:FKBP-type peptidyl-prolyl cis-trans isomerase n=1 Tax=Erythrobacter sp. EC-HK427 TaxID=2038396 RepID=UPI0012568C0F|nr:FKBP-type peptidyl-prolyl cis-trans isomerase [Erythrobacter sp. EC-HK427]VVS98119.1 Peptidyl-prolyl cis-trans isomerase [Erythrobacter sp. EC-HK427]
MTEVTRVPLRPIAGGSLVKLWLGVLAAVLLAGGIAWAAMPKGVTVDTVTAGEGEGPQQGDVVFVRYSGMLEDGTVFDQSQPAQWPIPGLLPEGTPMLLEPDALIVGFYEGLLQTQKGGTYEIFIPAEKAYGAEPPEGAPIPPNADLTFNVEIVDFMPEAEARERFQAMEQMLMQAQGGEGGEGAGGAATPPAEGAPQ